MSNTRPPRPPEPGGRHWNSDAPPGSPTLPDLSVGRPTARRSHLVKHLYEAHGISEFSTLLTSRQVPGEPASEGTLRRLHVELHEEEWLGHAQPHNHRGMAKPEPPPKPEPGPRPTP